jgi:hypothetical protein
LAIYTKAALSLQAASVDTIASLTLMGNELYQLKGWKDLAYTFASFKADRSLLLVNLRSRRFLSNIAVVFLQPSYRLEEA